MTVLCSDASGTIWFGGSAKARPTGSTGWDLGAYQGQGGTPGGPPSGAITAPSNNATISGASVTLTSTCTPQGAATVSSIQFYVDGISFSSAGSSSPYSATLDSTKLANANHTIYSVCTDSNSQTGTAPTITVTVSNSIPGCFITMPPVPGNIISQAITSQAGTFTITWTETPNSTTTNDVVVGLSNGPATAYSSMSALLRTNPSGFWDAYNGTTDTYQAANSLAYTAGTSYSISMTVNIGASTYSATVNGTTIANNYGFRAANTSLNYINGLSNVGVYDTAKVCNVQIAGGTSLSFSPESLSFGNVTTSTTSDLTINASATGGTVNFTSIVVSGAVFTKQADACGSSTATNCNVTVRFAPASAVAYTGALT
jgi:hypothetical protein